MNSERYVYVWEVSQGCDFLLLSFVSKCILVMFLTKDLFFILVWKYSSSCLFFFVESISKFISNLSLLSLFDFRLMIIYKPSKLVFLPIIRFVSKIICIYLRICPYSIYTWHAWLSKGPFSRIWFLSHIYLFFWVLENYVEGLKLSDQWFG